MPLVIIERRVRLDRLSFIQLQYILILVKINVKIGLFSPIFSDQVIPNFYNVIVKVNMPFY